MRRVKSSAVYTSITTAAVPAWWPAWCLAALRDSKRHSPDSDAWRVAQRLQDNAVALGGLDHTLQFRVIGIAVDLEPQRDIAETNRNVAIDAKWAARVPPALGDDPTAAQ